MDRASTSSSYPSSLGNVVRSKGRGANISAYARAIRPGVPRRLSVSSVDPERGQERGGGAFRGGQVDRRRRVHHPQRAMMPVDRFRWSGPGVREDGRHESASGRAVPGALRRNTTASRASARAASSKPKSRNATS